MESVVWLMMWSVLVGLDLASVAQTMIARPLVAGTVAGMIVGDPAAGATVGVVLELFALDVLPVGAARYPDYGIGAVAAAATAAGAPGILGTGVSVGVGLAVAYLGGVGIHVVRVRNSADIDRHRAALDSGDPRIVAGLHLRGLGRDTLRTLVVAGLGLLLGAAAVRWSVVTVEGAVYVGIAVIGAALAAALSGAVRVTGHRVGLRWFVVGLAAGLAGVVWT